MVERSSRSLNIIQPRERLQIKLILAGECGIGKTSIVRQWQASEYSNKIDPTIGIDYTFKEIKNCILNIWDLSGHADFFEVRNEFYKDANAIVLVFDITSRKSFDSLDMWLREGNRFGATSVYVAVCGNKADLTNKRAIQKAEAETWASSRRFDYFEVSAATGQGINDMFETIVSKLK
jgi:DnaJ homolog subfamily C member 27